MQIGMVGLGRMGANMSRRLVEGGHEVVGFDLDPAAVQAVVDVGAVGATSIEALVADLTPPRIVWIMVPAGQPTQATIDLLAARMTAGDTIVDGGNSRYTDSVTRAASLAPAGISFVDSGTSGGIWGLTEGYCLMIGAEPETFARLEPIFSSLAPPDGYALVGPPGAGHYVKMIHNGVEYALMQAYGEGFALIHGGEFDIDVARVAELWRHGSVIRSWLLDLAAHALAGDPNLSQVADFVPDSGEGRWTLETAIHRAVPAPTIAMALFERFASRQDSSFSNKLITALRNEFGGHGVKPAEPESQ